MIVTREIDERVSEMSRLSEGIYERGLNEGQTMGEARGEARGQAKAVAGYMAHSGSGVDEALSALGIGEAERPAVLAALRELT